MSAARHYCRIVDSKKGNRIIAAMTLVVACALAYSILPPMGELESPLGTITVLTFIWLIAALAVVIVGVIAAVTLWRSTP